jgi:Holliday junction DNA helicase RuvB
MGLAELKKECNIKYFQILSLLKNTGNLREVHKLLIELTEGLVNIGKISIEEREKSNRKAIFLMKIAKSIHSNSDHKDIYFKLTGNKLEKTTSEFEFISNELEELKSRNSKSDLTVVSKITQVDEMPKSSNNKNNRPSYLSDFTGQEDVKTLISEAINAAKIKNRPLDHVLLYGPAGLGKTSLSKIVANEMNSQMIIMSGPTIKNIMSFVSIIKNVQYGDIVFIDEIHRINPSAAEAIYTVMEDFELSYVEKDKEGSRNITLNLPAFTFIGATTHSGLLEKPLRDRFPLQFKLNLYTIEDLTRITKSLIEFLGKTINEDAAIEVASRSRGVPRICNTFCNRLYDRALINHVDCIDLDFVNEFFEMNGVKQNGLNELDVKYLNTIFETFNNRAIGIDNIASCLSEGKDIIESQVEPYLIYIGFVQITPSGRMLTTKGLDFIQNI